MKSAFDRRAFDRVGQRRGASIVKAVDPQVNCFFHCLMSVWCVHRGVYLCVFKSLTHLLLISHFPLYSYIALIECADQTRKLAMLSCSSIPLFLVFLPFPSSHSPENSRHEICHITTSSHN